MYFLSETKWYGDLGLDYGTVNYRYTISTDQGRFWTDYTCAVPGIAKLYSTADGGRSWHLLTL